MTRPALDHDHCGRAQHARSLLLRSSAVAGSILLFFCPISLFLPRFHRKDLQYQNTLKQTNTLDNNTAKGLTNINKGVRFSIKQHSSRGKVNLLMWSSRNLRSLMKTSSIKMLKFLHKGLWIGIPHQPMMTMSMRKIQLKDL